MIDLVQTYYQDFASVFIPFFLGVFFGYLLTRPTVIALPPLEKHDD
jgi:hypothetical protein